MSAQPIDPPRRETQVFKRVAGCDIKVDVLGADEARSAAICGYLLRPRLRALVSFDGFGDITLLWEADPSSYYLEAYPPISREQALANVGTAPISEESAELDRSAFYVYCRQHGRWLAEVTGHDPRNEPRWFDAYCPARNIAADYPPTMLIHGIADTDVPCDESYQLSALMAHAGVEHELVTLDGIGHGLSGASAELVASVEKRAAAFLVERLNRAPVSA